ncbi:hypothetical protein K7432_009281 [Basidiobolus ranarum]|uniref:Major facilitator superfamily (MFS) profile domain-containing protein n=1 Tax=Basidiobolus ranarum TaxID=34480 RepID=A0ABR2WQH6_9FUNG
MFNDFKQLKCSHPFFIAVYCRSNYHTMATYEETPLLSSETEEKLTWRERIIRFRSSKTAITFVVSLALFADMVVYGIVVPILPLIAKDKLNADPAMVGLLFGTYAFGLLGSTPIFAILSDRYNTRKIPMVIGLFGLGVSTIFFIVAENFWQLMLARMAQGAAGGASWTIGLTMIADAFPPDQLGVAMGVVLSWNGVGFLVGPAIGGILFEYWGFAAPFIFCAALAFIDLLAQLYVIPATPIDHDDEFVDTTGDVESQSSIRTKPSIWTLIRERPIIICSLATFLIASNYSSIEPTLGVYLEEEFHYNPSTIGVIYMALVIPNVFMSPIAGYLSSRFGGMTISGLGIFVFALVTPLIALPRSFWLESLSLVLCGAAGATAMTPILPEMGLHVTKLGGGAFAQLDAIFNMAYSLGMLGGPIAGGYLMKQFGFLKTTLAFGMLLLVFTPLIVIKKRSSHITTPS